MEKNEEWVKNWGFEKCLNCINDFEIKWKNNKTPKGRNYFEYKIECRCCGKVQCEGLSTGECTDTYDVLRIIYKGKQMF